MPLIMLRIIIALLIAAAAPVTQALAEQKGEDRITPGRFVFYEIFASKADFEAHNATPHVQAWFRRLPEPAEGGVKVMQLKILGNLPAEAR